MEKKLQIFVSSTFEDLRKERQLVIEAILEMGHLPAGMEYFVSDNIEQFELIKKWIQEADAYILISGGRYGSINESDAKKRSYTHLEYEYASKLKKPVKVLRLSDSYIRKKKKIGIYSENDITSDKLIEFRNHLPMSNNVGSINDIKSEAKTIIGNFNSLLQQETYGWIKAKNCSDLFLLHPNNIKLARDKSLNGSYYVYYYSKKNNRPVYSRLKLSIKDDLLVSYFYNDIQKNNRPMYSYKGRFEVFDDFLYLEMKSNADNEKVFLSIRLLPGRFETSIGILVAQGSLKQAVATTCIISRKRINNDILNEFIEDQRYSFEESESLVIDDESIHNLLENIDEYKK